MTIEVMKRNLQATQNTDRDVDGILCCLQYIFMYLADPVGTFPNVTLSSYPEIEYQPAVQYILKNIKKADGSQQSTGELIHVLFDVFDAKKDKKDIAAIPSHFTYTGTTTYTCKANGTAKPDESKNDNIIALNTSKAISLIDLLKEPSEVEESKEYCASTSTTTYVPKSDYVMINLQRIKTLNPLVINSKLNVTIPSILPLDGKEYQLYGSVMYKGSSIEVGTEKQSTAGHYIYDRIHTEKTNNGGTEMESVFYNDSNVSKQSDFNLENNGTILIYKRVYTLFLKTTSKQGETLSPLVHAPLPEANSLLTWTKTELDTINLNQEGGNLTKNLIATSTTKQHEQYEYMVNTIKNYGTALYKKGLEHIKASNTSESFINTIKPLINAIADYFVTILFLNSTNTEKIENKRKDVQDIVRKTEESIISSYRNAEDTQKNIYIAQYATVRTLSDHMMASAVKNSMNTKKKTNKETKNKQLAEIRAKEEAQRAKQDAAVRQSKLASGPAEENNIDPPPPPPPNANFIKKIQQQELSKALQEANARKAKEKAKAKAEANAEEKMEIEKYDENQRQRFARGNNYVKKQLEKQKQNAEKAAKHRNLFSTDEEKKAHEVAEQQKKETAAAERKAMLNESVRRQKEAVRKQEEANRTKKSVNQLLTTISKNPEKGSLFNGIDGGTRNKHRTIRRKSHKKLTRKA